MHIPLLFLFIVSTTDLAPAQVYLATTLQNWKDEGTSAEGYVHAITSQAL